MNGAVGVPESRERALLAIDTSLGTSVALGIGDRVFEAVSDDPMRHAEIVGPLLERVLDESGVDPSRIAGVVCGIGPGPFTGLRVGIAAARAFAVGRGVPLLPLHGHEAAAFEALSRGAAAGVRVVQDARRRELFVTEYSGLDWAELPVRSVDPHLVARAEYAEAPHEIWPERIPGGALIRLAALRLAAGRPFESERPLYLREPDIKQPGSPEAGLRMILRPATEADLDAIWRIEADVFAGEAWSREMMREELTADHRHYIALVDPATDAIRGYAGLLTVGSEGDIQTIAVVPEARGGGHGRALMRELLAEAVRRSVREVFLEVRADNPVAQRLYADLGFTEIGVRPKYYQPEGVDAIVMRLELSEGARG